MEEKEYHDFPSVILCIFSAFFYMTNFYILFITADEYSDALNMPKGYSGIISGISWLAVVAIAFVYSYWSNFNFKYPMLVTTGILTVGNVLYFLAYDYSASSMLLLGRLLIGLGGPRMIHRRYLSVYVTVKARTKWSTLYVFGTALGMSLGPFLAAQLYQVSTTFLGFSVNRFNCAGLVMGCVWGIFFVLVYLKFQEPPEHRTSNVVSDPRIEKDVNNVIPVSISLWALFFPKMLQECMIISASVVTKEEFDWDGKSTAIFIAIVTLVVCPVHFVIGATSKYIEDRKFMIVALSLCLFGSFILIDFDDLNIVQYTIGAFFLNLATNLSDGVSTSLTSKVLPPRINRGTFNSGLLSTTAGSVGRAMADIVVGLASNLDEDEVENTLFIPLSIVCGLSLVFSLSNYHRLVPLQTMQSPVKSEKHTK
jgi:MFS family permease